jgi:DNA-binding transcriptional LysR family regulator
VPPAFAQFRRRHPEVTLTVVDDHLQRLLPRLEAGELDLALIYEHEALPEISARDLERMLLVEDEFRAVLPAAHRLTRRRRALELSDLAAEPWIGGGPTSAWFRIVADACRLAGFTPKLASPPTTTSRSRLLPPPGSASRSSPDSPSYTTCRASKCERSGEAHRSVTFRSRDHVAATTAPPSPQCSPACTPRPKR